MTDGSSVLRQAEQAFRDALLEFNRDREPMEWAATLGTLAKCWHA